MSDIIRILYVGLESDISSPRKYQLDADNYHLLTDSTANAANGIDLLNEKKVDCIVSDYILPDMTGVEFLESVRDDYPDLPFIIYTDKGNEAVASEAIDAGVTNYIPSETGNEAELFDSILEAVKQYQSKLERHRRERRYQAILEDPNLLVGIVDADGKLLEANRTAAAYIDSDVEEMIEKPFWETEWWDEDTEALVRQKIKRAASGEYVDYKAELTDASDNSYNVSGTIRPVTDEAGHVVSLVISALDITEQKIQFQRFKQEQQLVRGILDALPDVFYAFDASGYLLRWNEQLKTVTGYSEDEIEEMYVTDFVPDGEVMRIGEHFQTVISEHRPVTVESAFETKDGDSIPYEFTGGPLKTADGKIRGLIGIGRDISDRKQRQRQFEAVFNNTYQFTGLMDPDGTIIEANQTALSFGGLERNDIVGEKLWDAYFFQKSETTRDTAIKAVEQARNGDLFRDQIEVQGRERDATIDFSVRPVTDEDGSVTLLIPEGRDITRLKEREQQLRVTNRVLRHNIRNQLMLIQGTATSIVADSDEAVIPKAESIVEAADDLFETAETTRRLNELIETEPEPETIDLVSLVETAVDSIRDRHPKAEIDLKIPETAPAEGIPTIEITIKELIKNAIIHNENSHPRVAVSIAVESSVIEVVVADNAGGLPEIEREILTGDITIDPLAHGQGLGLWYVYWTVRYSGGSIAVSEQCPNGTEIQLTLPLSNTQPTRRRLE